MDGFSLWWSGMGCHCVCWAGASMSLRQTPNLTKLIRERQGKQKIIGNDSARYQISAMVKSGCQGVMIHVHWVVPDSCNIMLQQLHACTVYIIVKHLLFHEILPQLITLLFMYELQVRSEVSWWLSCEAVSGLLLISSHFT